MPLMALEGAECGLFRTPGGMRSVGNGKFGFPVTDVDSGGILTQIDQRMAPIERGAFGMPRPQGWTLERTIHLLAGGMVLVTLALGRKFSARWRMLTGFVGANLLLDAAVGWCPTSVVLHRLGIPTATERVPRCGT